MRVHFNQKILYYIIKTTMNFQQKFKQRNPNYFKEYYKRNLQSFQERNKNRPSSKKLYYVLHVDNKKYCFKNKKDINIEKININEYQNKDDLIML